MAEVVAQRRDRTERLVRRASLLSPALAMQLAGDHFAGTSAARFVAFDAHAARAEREWHAFFGPRIMRLQDLSLADMGDVPVPGAFERRVSAVHAMWALCGLLASLGIAATWFRRSAASLRR